MEQAFQAAFLGIIQGVTEFLPISSSGHLIVVPALFGWQGTVDTLEFDVALHAGSTLAVIGFFWRDWLRVTAAFLRNLLKERNKILSDLDSKLLVLIVFGSIPAAVVGLLFKDFIESNTRSVLLVGVTLIVFGLLLWWVDKISNQKRKPEKVGWKDALLVGTAQAVSLIPGVSRSGITITAARRMSLDREAAVRFSFLLSTPAILGATVLTFGDYLRAGSADNLSLFLVGFISAAISGWLAIKFLLLFIRNNGFLIFMIYRIVLGSFLIVWSLIH